MLRFTTEREIARNRDDVELLGLDHIVVQNALRRWAALPPDESGAAVLGEDAAVLTVWKIETHGTKGLRHSFVKTIVVGVTGERLPHLEIKRDKLFHQNPARSSLPPDQRMALLSNYIEPMLNRELSHQGISSEGGGFSSQLIAWVEMGNRLPDALAGVSLCGMRS